MRPFVVIIVGYAAALAAGGLVLHRRGQRSRRLMEEATGGTEPIAGNDWARATLPQLHTAVGVVAAGAATLLPLVALAVGAQGPELVLLVAASAAGLVALLRLLRTWRS